MRILLLALLLIVAPVACAADQPPPWTLINPTRSEYTGELIRIGTPVAGDSLAVTEDGKPVPFDLWPDRDGKTYAWVAVTIGPKSTRQFALVPGKPAAGTGKIKITSDAVGTVLDNGLVAIRLPASGTPTVAPPPIAAIRVGSGGWVAAGTFSSSAKVTKIQTTVGTGNVAGFAKVVYTFDGTATYTFNITLPPDRQFAEIHEEFDGLPANSAWTLDLAAGWGPRNAAVELNNEGNGAGAGAGVAKDKWPRTLAVGQTRMGDTLVNLLPRWSQSFDDGWYFATHDGKQLLGVLPARAGQWRWPHDNKILVKVKPTADAAILHLPIESGARTWLLIAGPVADLAGKQRDLAVRHTMANLNKLNTDYILTWPGMTAGEFEPAFFFDNNTNPTGARRSQGRGALKDALAGKKGNLSTLFAAQQNLDPDWYGSYAQFWSPQNPNFFTDFHKLSLALVAQLREHPQYPRLRAKAEAIFRDDMDHSVTLPGGAGQECPGYQLHAAAQWRDMAPLCKLLGFDPTTWPRWKANGYFVAHLSIPLGDGRRGVHPAGDTHPNKTDPIAAAASFGYDADPKKFASEELPGFGAVLRNRPGTARETFLSFKSGPNRGHYHGDQLSIFLALNGKPVAVDHHCSYRPRAGQEHMHNRLAFSTKDMPFANMDGYERLIAFNTSPTIDIAVGQVESSRLRAAKEFPPEEWDERRTQAFDKPLIYRRTVILLKGEQGGQDVVILRDQYWGPSVNVHYMLHALGNAAKQAGNWIGCDGLSVFVAAPEKYAFAPFTWEHNNGGPEKTTGPRLTITGESAEFITVIVNGKPRADIKATPTGVQVGDVTFTFQEYLAAATENKKLDPTFAVANQVVARRGNVEIIALNRSEIDFAKSQGDVGLFVPDAGYPFGPIPQWLRAQRPARPSAGSSVPAR